MEVERWKTVSRNSPDFLSYLEGTFSLTHRALPVRSLNVGTLSEEVTFEIKPISEILRPSLWKILWQLMRPESLSLSLWPLLATLFFCYAHALRLNSLVTISSFFGVLIFHISVNLFNDYGDYIKGQDRVRPRGGSRVIQNGWVSAVNIKRAAWGLMGLGVLCGVPAIFWTSSELHPVVIVALLALLMGLEFAFQKFRLKYRGWAEIMAFALMGPLLTAGFAWASTGTLRWDIAVLGCVFGAIALMYFHSGNFENIMDDSQAGVRTWATRAGFDSSKKFFYFTALLVFAGSCAYAGLFEQNVLLVPFIIAQACAMFALCTRVHRLASPLSSELTGLRWAVVAFCWLTTGVLLGALFTMALRDA
jgi:1,4-dihydroxy-2-naphthoate octaprenyltransferase